MEIFQTHSDREFLTTERCFIIEILNSADHPDLSVARARVPEQVETELHRLSSTNEYYYILSGEGIITVDEVQKKVSAGDCIFIHQDQTQKIKNIGTGDLIFLCLCLPRFQESSYQSLE